MRPARVTYLSLGFRSGRSQRETTATNGIDDPNLDSESPGDLFYEPAKTRARNYWANFIATGDPNGKSLPKWEAYNMKTNDGKGMVLGDTVEFEPQIDVSRLAFFDKYYAAAQTK
jgi:hypothetical protein